jgi:hypothetical protein
MKKICLIVFVLLGSLMGLVQKGVVASTTQEMDKEKIQNALLDTVNKLPIEHHITIRSSFGVEKDVMEWFFINNSTKTITAYATCHLPSNATRWQGCEYSDTLPSVIDRKIQLKRRPWLGPYKGQVVAPGEHSVVSLNDHYDQSVQTRVVAVVYDDGSFEGDSELASAILADRKDILAGEQFIVGIFKSILESSPGNEVVTATTRLEDKRQSLVNHGHASWQGRLWSAIEQLKHPPRRNGNEGEFVPNDQLAYLKDLLAQHEDFVRQFMPYLSGGSQ